jgi:hypothetical protein
VLALAAQADIRAVAGLDFALGRLRVWIVAVHGPVLAIEA